MFICYRRFIGAVVLTVFCKAGFAQVAPSPTEQAIIDQQQNEIIQRQQQQQQELLRERQLELQRPSSLGLDAELPELQVGEDSVCFDIHEIQLEGSTQLSKSTQEKLIAPYLAKCLGLGEINRLIRDITNHYIDKGFITTRALLSEQDITSGKLIINIIEGSIDELSLNNSTASKDKRQLATAFPGIKDQLLNIRDIEQGVDQLNRLRSNDARIELLPGGSLGSTNLLVENKRSKTWQVYAGLNNTGQSSTGTVQRNIRFEKDNLLNLNDYWSINYSQDNLDSSTSKSRSVAAFLTIPYGAWTFSASSSYFDYQSSIPGLAIAFDSTGNSFTNALTINRVVHRDRTSKTSLDLGFTHRNIDNFIEGNRIEVGSRNLSVLRAAVNHSRSVLQGFLALSFGHERGLRSFSALDDPPNVTPGSPRAQFEKYTASFNFIKPYRFLGLDGSYSLSFNGQFSDDDLFSSEQISLGGQGSIRGFKDQIVLGDTGGYVRNEFALNLPTVNTPVLQHVLSNLQVFAAYDYGKIKTDRLNDLERGVLQGWATGLRKHSGYLDFEVVLSKPLAAPRFISQRNFETYITVGLKY